MTTALHSARGRLVPGSTEPDGSGHRELASLNLSGTPPSEDAAATPSNFGRFDSFLYKDWRYPRDARNKSENRDVAGSEGQAQKRPGISQRERLAEPDYLCFIQPDGRAVQSSVSEWTESNGRTTPTDYVFVSFTGQQFPFNDANNAYLHAVGIHAARAIGVNAYWCCNSCLAKLIPQKEMTEESKRRLDQEKQQSVWNMSDIIRRARALVIVVSGPLDAQLKGQSLRQWGQRCWTMPELLLYTGSDPIFVYEKIKSLDDRRSIPRRELWNKSWSETAYSGQLIDHYEGSLLLTPLELNTVALHCIQDRYTTEHLRGDLACILMGLLRQRPAVVASDNEFQAFARLSLANDSNKLLERMICLLPNSLAANWWSLEDFWTATLWDIEPKIQICGIAEGETAIIDGAQEKYQLGLMTFGSYEGRLSWSVASNPLSRHNLNPDGMRKDFPTLGDEESVLGQNMYTGVDPVESDTNIKELVDRAAKTPFQAKKIFTLVDTYTMTVTLFEAVRPPIAVVICGAEGGMQRALLCSEDWRTGTMYRETVVRMETRVWDRMDTLARLRLGLKRERKREAIESS
ncbi:MAG: hypothetical protein Q9216_003698 [Gyalolechia sp. 2 TL-2023]